jgi:uncharacterized protein (TIGR03067 family)
MSGNLEGNWRQVAASENGEVIDHESEIILTIKGSTFVVKRNGVREIEGIFEVDSVFNPTSIDWTDLVGADAGKIFKSLCLVNEVNFEFCAADQGMPRPQSFEPKTGHTIRCFERMPV